VISVRFFGKFDFDFGVIEGCDFKLRLEIGKKTWLEDVKEGLVGL
jgi:hypothetical protein